MTDGPVPGLPAELLPLSWLVGRWVGVGVVGYPSMESDLRFGQELDIATDGRPFLTCWSRTWLLDDDGQRVKPLAMETGFWRPRPDNGVELVLAHPTGYAEAWSGTVTVTGIENAVITGARAQLRTDAVASTPSAKPYTAGERLYGLVEGALMWAYDMAAVGHGMTSHASARLTRA